MTTNTQPSGFPLTPRFTEALNLAASWHYGQYRKVSAGETAWQPYLAHLLGVAAIALEFGASEDEAIAALLHDALEDGPDYTGRDAADLHAELGQRFGPAVAQMVLDATETPREQARPRPPGPSVSALTSWPCRTNPLLPC